LGTEEAGDMKKNEKHKGRVRELRGMKGGLRDQSRRFKEYLKKKGTEKKTRNRGTGVNPG